MRVSQLATRTLRNAPADEVAASAQLLIRAGYIHKEMAGVYDYLPLGYMTLQNIISVIREEMNAIGGQEIYLSGLQNPDVWKASGRWDDEVVDVWFKTLLKNGQEIGLGNTHEEALAALLRQHITSYTDLPKYLYQFQTKFRNELRAKSGIMRTREFIMKDLYSFSASVKEHEEFYERCKDTYKTIFNRLGIGDQTFLTYAGGGSFAKFSHEFQTICPAGEDTIFVHEGKKIAINQDVLNEDVLSELQIERAELVERVAAEVGNIFNLGTKYSDALGLMFTNDKGARQPVVMGSYGIGPGRVMGVMVELLSDEKGLVWPQTIAPYQYYLIGLGSKESQQRAEDVYKKMLSGGMSVLYDDRDERAGVKFADADLLGIPTRLVVSDSSGEKIEQKSRTSDAIKQVEWPVLLEK